MSYFGSWNDYLSIDQYPVLIIGNYVFQSFGLTFYGLKYRPIGMIRLLTNYPMGMIRDLIDYSVNKGLNCLISLYELPIRS